MKENSIPAALILGYRREQGVLNAINSCANNGVKRIYLSLDGEDSPEGVLFQKKLISSAEALVLSKGMQLFVNGQLKHLGLRKAVLFGIDWFFDSEDYGVILEDDLEISDDFFNFISYFVGFETDDDVLFISGNAARKNPTSSLTNYPLVWGWGTTSEKWRLMKSFITGENQNSKGSQVEVGLLVKNFWLAGKWRVKTGAVDSWAISLAAEMRLRGFKAIIPPVNLVTNRGTDLNATHTSPGSPGLLEPTEKLSNFEFKHIDTSLETIRFNNKYLEKHRYQIRFRNYFSPLFVLGDFLRNRVRRNFSPLKISSVE
jgi:hypothetical protein